MTRQPFDLAVYGPRFLAYLDTHGPTAGHRLIRAVGIAGSATGWKLLRTLEARGAIVRLGSGNRARYGRPSGLPEAIPDMADPRKPWPRPLAAISATTRQHADGLSWWEQKDRATLNAMAAQLAPQMSASKEGIAVGHKGGVR